jgi:hypothetical protein
MAVLDHSKTNEEIEEETEEVNPFLGVENVVDEQID